MSKPNKTVIENSDMNFFSEFSSSSAFSGSTTSLLLLLVLAFLIVGIGIYGIFYFRVDSIKTSIDSLNTEMASEEYQKSFSAYANINEEINTYTQQYYDVSSLYYRAAEMSTIDSLYMDTIQDNLPIDITLTDFTYEDGSVTVTGLADSYYSPLDLVSNLSAADIFTYVEISSITQRDLTSYPPEESILMKPYLFSIIGSIDSSYPVKVSRMLDGEIPTPLTAVSNTEYKLGETYLVDGINTFVSGNNIYTLSRVDIDNATVIDPAVFSSIQQADAITGTVTTSVDIVLYYSTSSTSGGNK